MANRNVSSAVFTTYNFDPGFFELHVLPILFPNQHFSEAERVRLLQLEDCLRSIRHLTVYFDGNALARDASSPRLGYSRIDVHWKSGCFHPKLILLLVDETNHAGCQSLIVCCQSANLTRSGWWENVECVHIEEIRDRSFGDEPCSFRRDLMDVLTRFSGAMRKEQHDALEKIHSFLYSRVYQLRSDESNHHWHTRIFGGRGGKNFSQWLADQVHIPEDLNLEIVSPYFNKDDIKPLNDLVKTTNPRATRIYLPQASDGKALVSEKVYEQVQELRNVSWARLPSEFTKREGNKAAAAGRIAPRFVHAKIYRFWRRQQCDLVVVGSVNCTSQAHSKPDSGNLEVAVFLDLTNQGAFRRWWLESKDETVENFESSPTDETDGKDEAMFDFFIRYDWAKHEVAIRFDDTKSVRFPIVVSSLSETPLFSIHSYEGVDWQIVDNNASDRVRTAIEQSSFVTVECEDIKWRVLVREHSFSHRPSLLSSLTPEEILKYWSLLSPDQRTVFLERHVHELIEGLPNSSGRPAELVDSVFSQFSGIYHAFGHFYRHVLECLGKRETGVKREAEVETRLFGAKYDSLPELLRKLLESDDGDPIQIYVTFLTAQQLRNKLVNDNAFAKFFDERVEMLNKLDELITKGLQFRERLFPEDSNNQEFLTWFEQTFMMEFN
ncbi:MAG: hypothetical protein OXG88_03310 [Gammaproteobacteria bacterium]|nr:hypothetical protein [Gammaproteobacteria bacterium]